MKTKLLVLTAVATLLIIATVAMASGNLTLEPVAVQTEVFTPSFDRLASYMGYDTEEKFLSFHKVALFMGKYCDSKDSFSFIENMILSGCDIQTTMDIYQFYLTTNEPIEIVKQIYDMVYVGEKITNRDAVFENAFNELTNNKCGVLTKEDVDNYLEKGLSVSDISQANLLSRKGVMTIQEILDANLSGTSWEDLVEIVLDESTLPSDTCEVLATAYSSSDYSIVRTPLKTIHLKANQEDYFSQKTKEINNQLKEKGYWKGKKSANFKFIAETAERKGITVNELSMLLDEGYNEKDLINALNDPTCTPKTIDSIIKKEVEKE